MNLPQKFLDYMKAILGDEYDDYINCLNEPSHHGIRINRLKYTDDFSKISPFSVSRIPYIDNGYIYDNKENPAKDSYYYAGLYYVQEPSAMLPANRLPIEEGDKVLDLCAAPGGKATELAGKLNGTGLLYANDISASRANALLKNLELAGAPNIYVTAEKPENLEKRLPLFFDKILCDVPCSGEGMFRKEPSLIKAWEERGPEYYQPIQREIIESAYNMLKPGGMMMYSTCTFNELEDEANIQFLLDNHPDLELCDIEWYEGFTKGFSGLDKCVRVFPHKMMGEGHFLALLKKKGEPSCEVACKTLNNNKKIILSKDKKTQLEYVLPNLSDNGYRDGLRYLRTGICLEDLPVYAMTLCGENYDVCFNLSHDDQRVIRYLKGETIFTENDEEVKKGLVLILVNSFPLGFCKSDGNGRLKNMYNASWRMM